MNTVALIMFAAFAIMLMISVPVAVALATSVLTVVLVDGSISLGFEVIVQRMYAGLESSSIMAIPFFILAGNIMTKGGISRRLVDFANALVGGIRGGMGLALVLACAFFAALSGSAPATVIAIGLMLFNDMARLGYDKNRTAGMLVVSGGLGPIIPPSIIMVVYATLTNASVGDMFKSGMVIGMMIVAVLMMIVLILASKEKWPRDTQPLSIRRLLRAAWKAIPALMLPIIILGGIYSGLVTPTESAVLAVVWSLFVAIFVYREISVKDLFGIFVDSAKSSAMILFIIAASTSFSWLFAFSGTSSDLVAWITGMNLSPMVFAIVVSIVLVIFGMFLEGIATAVLMVPILWPVAEVLGMNVIHFGMIVAISNVIGTMTPPVAVNIFAAQTVSKLKVGQIVRGELPFFLGYVAVFFLVVLIPALSTFML